MAKAYFKGEAEGQRHEVTIGVRSMTWTRGDTDTVELMFTTNAQDGSLKSLPAVLGSAHRVMKPGESVTIVIED